MVEKADEPRQRQGLSRRNLLGAAAAAVPAAAMPAAAADMNMAGMKTGTEDRTRIPDIEALETLNADEADTLEAICARLIPTDDKGPGAAEARAAHYIDRSLAGALSSLRETYANGFAALDQYARTVKGSRFVDLAAADQDAVLHDLESNKATGFTPNSASFFALLRAHTIQGTFCDPYYGGNQDFVGWDLIAYPGIRMPATADDQQLKAPKPLRKSVYDGGMFGRGGSNGHLISRAPMSSLSGLARSAASPPCHWRAPA